jgi:hypothetical protein
MDKLRFQSGFGLNRHNQITHKPKPPKNNDDDDAKPKRESSQQSHEQKKTSNPSAPQTVKPKPIPEVKINPDVNVPLSQLPQQNQPNPTTHTLSINNIPTDVLKTYNMAKSTPLTGIFQEAGEKRVVKSVANSTRPLGAPLVDVDNKGVPADLETKVKQLASQLPDSYQSFLKSHGVKIEVVKDLGALGTIPGFGSAVGIYLFKENVIRIPQFITIFSAGNPNGTQIPNPEITLNLMTHEASHAVDRWLGDDQKVVPAGGYPPMYNFKPELVKAYAADLKNLNKNLPSAQDRATLDYILNTKSGIDRARVEAMAETMAALENGKSTRPSALIFKALPTFTKLVRDALDNFGFTTQDTQNETKKLGKNKKRIETKDVPKLIKMFENTTTPKGIDNNFLNGGSNPGSSTAFQTGKANPGSSTAFQTGSSIKGIDRFLNG